MNHEEGPHPGIRGQIKDSNNNFLLVLNGRLLNGKMQTGAKSELEQWDLADIQKIEIVRGPGSVIYGPGAVAGVISIKTHTGTTAPGLSITANYRTQYNSRGVSVRYGHDAERWNLFAFASTTRTDGAKVRQFLVTEDNEAGFLGETIPGTDPPMEYFGDFQSQPQLKFHVGVEWSDHWKAWLRYTQQGSNWRSNETKTRFGDQLLNQQGLQDRQWVATLDYQRTLSETTQIRATVSADSLDAERTTDNTNHPEPNHVLNKRYNFSEFEVWARLLINWQIVENAELALGFESAWDDYGAGWGDRDDDMLLGESGTIINGPESNAIDRINGRGANRNGTALFVGDGWSTHSYALFAEANLDVRPWLKALISTRSDKSSHSSWLLSPRLALIATLGERQYLKLIAQRSQRLNTASQVLTEVRMNGDPDAESLDGIELIYDHQLKNSLALSLSGFWNETEVIAWNADVNSRVPVGDLRLWGTEIELSYHQGTFHLISNYAYLQQLDWRLAPGVPSSGISYSDYNQPLRKTTAIQRGHGNNLNNWPNQSLKAILRWQIAESAVLHLDSRAQWDFQGRKDGLTALQTAVAHDPNLSSAVAGSVEGIEAVGAFGVDFRLNASVTYQIGNDLEIQASALNLLGSNGNKRYAYDSGNDKPAPRKVRLVDEPRAYGFNLRWRL